MFLRFVLDTNVVVAGLRSPTGVSATLLDGALSGTFTLLLSVALALEYEAVCCAPQQRRASGLSEAEAETVVSALCAVAEPVEPRFLWRPQLRDPGAGMAFETAVNGTADALATFNRRDFGAASGRFDLAVLTPRRALERIST